MEKHDDDHCIGAPVVETMDKPAERHHNSQIIEAVVGIIDGWYIKKELKNTGNNLYENDGKDRAA
jgi:hypothetical protein